MSDRIITSNRSVGGSGTTTITEIGATVVHSQKGFEKPLFFGANNSATLKNYLGAPSVAYPNVAEAYDFNTVGNLWVSAPSKDGRHGAIAIPKVAAPIAYPMGLTPSDLATNILTDVATDYKSTEVVAGLEGTYSVPLAGLTPESLFVYLKDGTKLVFDVVSNAGVETYVLSTPAQWDLFTSAELTLATGVLVVTLTNTTGFSLIDKIGVSLDKATDLTAEGTLVVVTSTPTNIPVSLDITDSNGLISISAYETVAGVTTFKKRYLFSLDENSLDDYGRSNYYQNVVGDTDPFIRIFTLGDITSYVAPTLVAQALTGSSRGAALPATSEAGGSYAVGWNYFKNKARYKADIFFDPSSETATPGMISDILSTAQLNKSGIYAVEKLSAEDILADPATAAKGISNPDMACYDSWHIMANTYGTGNIVRNLTGRIAVKYAQMVDIFDSGSPSFTDENNHGGQIGSGVIEALFTDRAAVALQLDSAHINYVGEDLLYGLMIQGDRTRAADNGDYSYVGRRRIRNLITDQMVSRILPPQINKPNDATHRLKIYNQGVTLLAPMINSGLDDALIVCDESNNTALVRNANEFVVDVVIQITPNSQRIRLNVINVDQLTSVTDYIGG